VNEFDPKTTFLLLGGFFAIYLTILAGMIFCGWVKRRKS